MRVLRNAIVILGVVAVALTVRPSFAQSRTEEIADAKAEMEQAKQYLQALARQRQGLTEELSVDEKEWVGAALLDWYRTSRKFNSLREQRDNGDISEKEAIRQLEEFTGAATGELSLEGAFVKAGEKVRKGRLQMYDDLDRRQDLVMQRFRDAWERVRALENRPRPDELKAAERVQGGPLTLKAVPSSVDLEVGEPGIVTLVVSGSKPPYTLRVVSLSGDDTRVLRLDSQDFVDLPFSFSTPGVRTVDISLEDESIPRQRARVTVTFRVTEPEEDEGETEEEPPAQPSPERDAGDEEKEDDRTSKDDEDKDPEEEEKGDEREDEEQNERWMIKPGTYDAVLHTAWTGIVTFGSSKGVPVKLTVDASGRIRGTCDYSVPSDRRERKAGEGGVFRIDSINVSLHLDGETNAQTGATNIRIRDLRMDERRTYLSGDGTKKDRTDFVVQMELTGWRIPGPHDSALLDGDGVSPGLAKAAELHGGQLARRGLPEIGRRKDGNAYFTTRGFCGLPPDSVKATCTKNVIVNMPGNTYENTAGTNKNISTSASTTSWFLKIMGETVVPPERPEETTVAPAEGELVGFGIWPESPLRVKPGATFQLEAVGVYAENIFDVKQLHDDRSEWDAHSGLEELEKPGQYRPLGPGPYQVRVRRQRNDGSWMSDTVTIHVTP